MRILLLGDHVNTDLLHPPQFFGVTPETALPGFLAGLPPEYAAGFQAGDWLVAGRNFGCGSSREAYVRAFQAAGVGGVIAQSVARICYRNLINAGIPVATHPTLYRRLTQWEEVSVDREQWALTRMQKNEVIPLIPPEPQLRRILDAGGLLRSLGLENDHAA